MVLDFILVLSRGNSRTVAEMNCFFGTVDMTVVDKHTCSSPVVIKFEAICVTVDVVVYRFDFFVIFLLLGCPQQI